MQYDKLNEEKHNTEKKLRQFLGNIANNDMSNLQEIKLGMHHVNLTSDCLPISFDMLIILYLR